MGRHGILSHVTAVFNPLYSVLMDFPIHIDIISMELPIVYVKGSHVEFSRS